MNTASIHAIRTALLLFFILFCTTPNFSQERNIISESHFAQEEGEDELVLQYKIIYTHNEFNLILRKSWQTEVNDIFEEYKFISYAYDDQMRLQLEVDQGPDYTKTNTYTYQSGLCLEQVTRFREYDNYTNSLHIEYYNTSSCNLDSIQEFREFGGIMNLYYRYSIEYDGLITRTFRTTVGWNTNRTLLTSLKEFNESDQLVRDFYLSFGIETDFTDIYIDYDKHGSIIRYEYYYTGGIGIDPPLRHISYTDIIYNAEGFKLFEEITQDLYDRWEGVYVATRTSSRQYPYNCEGLLVKENYKPNPCAYSWCAEREIRFEYENSNCDDEYLANLRITPNNSATSFTIQSELLLEQDGELNIYSSDGREIQRLTNFNRLGSLDLDVTAWPAGLYFLTLNSNGRMQQGSIMKI